MASRVLVVEDNDDCRTLMAMLLSHLGYSVIEATNGLEGIEKAISMRPDLILMDLRMPKMGGLEATRQLKENLTTRDIPIVICTALGPEAFGYANLTDYPFEILQKPTRLEKIRDVVRKYVPQPDQPATSPDESTAYKHSTGKVREPQSINRPSRDVFVGRLASGQSRL